MRNQRRIGRLGAALAVVAVLAAACSSSSTTKGNTPGSASSGAVKFDTNATMTYYAEKEAENWNINSSDGNLFDTVQILDRVWPSVYHILPDLTLGLDKTLMVSATQTSTSPQTIVFQLNPKAVWGDGVPIGLDDFVYAWHAQSGDDQFKDADGAKFTPATTSGYSQIQSITADPADAHKITVVFSSPFPDWKGLFGADNPLMPAHFATANKIAFNAGYTDPVKQILSGGPFMITAYTKGQSIVLGRNPKYWGAPANLASITNRFITDSTQFEPALANGELNAGYPTPQADLVAQLKALPGVTMEIKAGLQFEHLDLNLTNKWLKDDAVRSAIMKVIDRPGLLDRTVKQFAPDTTVLNNRQFVTNQPGYKDTSGGQFDKGDVPAAKAILTSAGYTFGADGSLTKDGEKVAMRITSTQGNKLRSDEEQYVISQIKQIGITATETDTPDLSGTLTKGDFDMIIYAFVSTPFPSGNDAIYQTGGGSNYIKGSDPAIDALFKSASVELDPVKRIDDYNQVDALVWKDHWTMPLFQRPTLLVFQNKYVNMHNAPSAEGPVYNEEEWGVKAP